MSAPITTEIIEWYKKNGRTLPWRQTTDPYKIWISEIILQQTRVRQGLDYYVRFIETFPTIQALASASQQEVMRLWQGLGYYSRARNLMYAAQQIVTEYCGIFPDNYEDIRKLKGVGEYTAAAIASFAFRLPYATIDGNVFRILSRLFNCNLPIDSSKGRNYFFALAQELIEPNTPDLFNQATMELGATVCSPKNPKCTLCPLSTRCLAKACNTIEELPVKQGKTKIRSRYFNYLHLEFQENIIISQRNEKDIWNSLYEFPLIESDMPISIEQLLATPYLRSLMIQGILHFQKKTLMPKHQLSHQSIHATFYRFSLSKKPTLTPQEKLIPSDQINAYPIPKLIERYLKQCY